MLTTFCGDYLGEHYCYVKITHYDITIGNGIARDTHCNIVMDNSITIGNDVARDIHCDVTISNNDAMSASLCIMPLL